MLQVAAASAGAVVVGGSLPEAGPDGAVYNTCVVVGGDGTILATHRKVHLFDVDVPGGVRFKESDALAAGGAVTSFSMADPVGTVGVGICYDVRFPEYAGVLVRERGARLLVFPGAFNSTTGPAHWELLLRARAVDGQCYVVACSPAWGADGAGGGGKGYEAWGHSMVVGPWGDVRVVAGRGEETLYVDIDMEDVRRTRRAIPTSVQRRLDLYSLKTVGGDGGDGSPPASA